MTTTASENNHLSTAATMPQPKPFIAGTPHQRTHKHVELTLEQLSRLPVRKRLWDGVLAGIQAFQRLQEAWKYHRQSMRHVGWTSQKATIKD